MALTMIFTTIFRWILTFNIKTRQSYGQYNKTLFICKANHKKMSVAKKNVHPGGR